MGIWRLALFEVCYYGFQNLGLVLLLLLVIVWKLRIAFCAGPSLVHGFSCTPVCFF